jgi:uncharacterized protein YbjT (DUF2867 family)
MILVTGATGNIGSEVLRLLKEKGAPVRILAREPSRVGPQPANVEVVQGDLTRPQTLPAAFAGIEKAFIVIAGGEALPEIAGPVFQAAKDAGVKHVVFVSSSTILMEPSPAMGRWHHSAEELLKATGLAWTMIRPGNFASNSLRWAGSIKGQGAVFAPASGQTYVLTGPEVMTPKRQLEAISTVLGRPLRFVDMPFAAAREQMVKFGMSETLADAILELQDGSRTQGAAALTTTVREVTGNDARSYETWLRDHHGAFR